jgi:dUTP pyrophosphatase
VANAPGTVDPDYTGPIKVMLRNLSLEPQALVTGTRVAQLVFEYVAFPELEVVNEANPTRHRDGFGSTGE